MGHFSSGQIFTHMNLKWNTFDRSVSELPLNCKGQVVRVINFAGQYLYLNGTWTQYESTVTYQFPVCAVGGDCYVYFYGTFYDFRCTFGTWKHRGRNIGVTLIYWRRAQSNKFHWTDVLYLFSLGQSHVHWKFLWANRWTFGVYCCHSQAKLSKLLRFFH